MDTDYCSDCKDRLHEYCDDNECPCKEALHPARPIDRSWPPKDLEAK